MKSNKKLLLFINLLLFAIAIIFINGCNKDNITESVPTDDQYLQSIVSGGYSSNQNDEDNLMSYETNDLDNGGAIGDNDNGPMTPIDSLHKWGRKVINVNLNYNITNEGDTLKVIHITRTISGNYVIQGYISGQLQTISKPYMEVFNRNVTFKRVNRLPNPRFNWRLYKISMLSGGTTQPQIGGDKVSITKAEIFINGSGTPSYVFNGPDFTQNEFTTLYFGGNGIPTINRNSSVKIKIYTTSQESEIDYVAWHWARNTFGFHRVPFVLESQTGTGPFYRVYTKTFNIYAEHKLGAHNGYISASTHESLYDDNPLMLASTEIGLLYKVLQ
ncbi:MAG TPA: hypothetical protein VIK14_10055 [Ignavibacteria bacterium]